MLSNTKILISGTGKFSKLFTNYLSQQPELSQFYSHFPSPENATNYFEKFKSVDRAVLVDSLKKQHLQLELSSLQTQNISALTKNNVFTVTTGHQLNIFCGPLFFIYKIITTIKSCQYLKAKYPEKDFVPIYWMASEDHDFEEINHFHLFGKKHIWETNQKGAVGRMQTTELSELIDQLKDLPEIFQVYKTAQNLADATRQIVHHLFKDYGLLILDADDKPLKQQFTSYIKEDVVNQSNQSLINNTTTLLEGYGYKGQIHPRAINFFYIDGDVRQRIVFEEQKYKVLNTEISWNEKEIAALIEKSPEKFSPNVALRPLYQQVILPNIAYIGGPGEIVYWLQLKSVFEHNKAAFPMLMPRNFGLYINQNTGKKLKKLNIDPTALFQSSQELKKQFLEKEGAVFNLTDELNNIEQLFESIKAKALVIDKSLDGAIGAESQRAKKQILNLEKRIQKADEKKHEQVINQILNTQNKLFPDGGLQERHDNFLNFYINDNTFIEKLMNTFSPFDYHFNIICDE